MTLWMVLMSFFNDISTTVPEGDYLVDIMFPSLWFVSAFFKVC